MRQDLLSPPRSFSALAASISVRIEAVSAKLDPGASVVSSSVAPAILPGDQRAQHGYRNQIRLAG